MVINLKKFEFHICIDRKFYFPFFFFFFQEFGENMFKIVE